MCLMAFTKKVSPLKPSSFPSGHPPLFFPGLYGHAEHTGGFQFRLNVNFLDGHTVMAQLAVIFMGFISWYITWVIGVRCLLISVSWAITVGSLEDHPIQELMNISVVGSPTCDESNHKQAIESQRILSGMIIQVISGIFITVIILLVLSREWGNDPK